MTWLGPLIIIAGLIFSIAADKLTIPAAITGALIGALVFVGQGYTGLLLMTAFFVLGTLATSWKKHRKIQLGVATPSDAKRNSWQVIANAGVGGALAALTILYPGWREILLVMMAAGFSSAAADTLSSELGNIYGSRFFNVLTFRRDQRGLDGVISAEGSLAGLFGSLVIAGVYVVGSGLTKYFLVTLISGTIGNLADSVLGASLERRGILNNDAVNFLNTLIAALVAGAIVVLISA